MLIHSKTMTSIGLFPTSKYGTHIDWELHFPYAIVSMASGVLEKAPSIVRLPICSTEVSLGVDKGACYCLSGSGDGQKGGEKKKMKKEGVMISLVVVVLP